MKTPGIHAFDPSAQVPELGSPMDNFPSIQKPQAKQEPSQEPTGVRSVPPVLPVRSVRRTKIRHPFDLYQDQVETLRQLALEERKRGEQGSMSAMVREAIDTYIAKKKQEEL
jgi:hypothetical protein